MRAGEVANVRELSKGVRADVCLGMSVKHGYAVITVTSTSPKVQKAMDALKRALKEDALENAGAVLADQAEWDRGKNTNRQKESA